MIGFALPEAMLHLLVQTRQALEDEPQPSSARPARGKPLDPCTASRYERKGSAALTIGTELARETCNDDRNRCRSNTFQFRSIAQRSSISQTCRTCWSVNCGYMGRLKTFWQACSEWLNPPTPIATLPLYAG